MKCTDSISSEKIVALFKNKDFFTFEPPDDQKTDFFFSFFHLYGTSQHGEQRIQLSKRSFFLYFYFWMEILSFLWLSKRKGIQKIIMAIALLYICPPFFMYSLHWIGLETNENKFLHCQHSDD